MTQFVSLSILAAMMAVTLTTGSAYAEEREGREGMRDRERQRCTIVRKCHRDDGRRICENVRVCRDRH